MLATYETRFPVFRDEFNAETDNAEAGRKDRKYLKSVEGEFVGAGDVGAYNEGQFV